MNLIDTHAHLYAKEFSEDIAEVKKRTQAAGVSQILLPNIDTSSIEPLHKLVESDPDYFIPMMGLHPCSVNSEYEGQLERIYDFLTNGKYCAVGEIGLDYYWDKTFVEQQKAALQTQINWAKELQLPVVLHSRDSFDDLYEIIAANNNDQLKGVFHCFTGTAEEAEKIAALGNFYLGVGGVVTFKNSNLDEQLKNIPLEMLLLETDAPYLTPAPFRGKRNESSYLSYVVEKIAAAKGITTDAVAAATTENAERLFSLRKL